MFKGLGEYLKSNTGKSSVRLMYFLNGMNAIVFTDLIIAGTFWLIYNNKSISESILIALLTALSVNAGLAGVNKVNQKRHQINGSKENISEETLDK